VFPKVRDQHKVGNPQVPNGLGVFYALFSTVYLFLVYSIQQSQQNPVSGVSLPSAAFTLATCVLFGGFMGMMDDWIDLKWRYKAFMPLIAALPLIYYAEAVGARTSITIPFVGIIDFGVAYFYIIVPLIVMIVTNTVNQLGGLNGLESICPAIVILGLMAFSPQYYLMVGPMLFWLVLAALNVSGKIFVGNTGSFAIGLTLASFAVISDLKVNLAISIIPYIFNSALILLTVFITHKRAKVTFDGQKLCSDSRKSLVTIITYKRPLSERNVVLIIAAIITAFTIVAGIIQLIPI
jgi:UDP-N-acetylglucosamine--dolichyl-phosphate N-acetylglucosaminephosphotransferase